MQQLEKNKSNDPNAVQRKQDHISLAFQSQVSANDIDKRFYYEPLFSAHPEALKPTLVSFNGKSLLAPIWISSMTGGTQIAKKINENLAKACNEFGLGMGLGSCRQLLNSNDNLKDFDVRKYIGNDAPLYANLGIGQLEELIATKSTYLIEKLCEKLQADGLIVHVNPMQEWLQPEGDRFKNPPIETIETILSLFPKMSIIVKEVGQGFGFESLKKLYQLPLTAVEFGASGGTNFSKLELLRDTEENLATYLPLTKIGHSAVEMVSFTNALKNELKEKFLCENIIISGGVTNFLDGYYLTEMSNMPSVYGQASSFLKHAQKDYESLQSYIHQQIEGLKIANAYLKIKDF
jgi:isopentenyl-diphosphate Delta-isomerase